ncbi:MAG: glycoside hydrolase, family 25 [Streptococcaceae bacterium]|jgi:hypothetical protein|nr:glycoside hydrolase, family 25 [Streptococcaceae bacterium]
MKKLPLLAVLSLTALGTVPAFPAQAETEAASENQTAIYRIYNKNTGEHFYTSNVYELINLQVYGWTSEGVGWYAPTTGEPVYRIYNPNSEGGDHYYTTSKYEAEYNVFLGWRWDNDGKPVFYSGGDVPSYVAYNPNALSGAHNYTSSLFEQNFLLNNNWIHGKKAWQIVKEGKNKIDLDQIMNKDLSTIQGIWKNDERRTVGVIGDQFILDDKVINDIVSEDLWSVAKKGNDSVTFPLKFGESSVDMVILPAGVKSGPNDQSDLSRDRIFIDQDGTLSNYFYRVGDRIDD